MDKEQRLAERAQELQGAERGYRGATKLADKTRGSLTQRKEDLDGRDEALKHSEGRAPEARRAQRSRSP